MTRGTYVWYDPDGEGRNTFALFRCEFALVESPKTARLHLFADSRYRLRVNGQVAGYGPARFVPWAPEYDTVDLTPHLSAGPNVLTVEVNHYGASSFQTMPEDRGGFVAWGEVCARGQAPIDLSTPGAWRVRQVDAWDPHSPPFSFAQGPVEILDLAAVPESWFLPGECGRGWSTPVPLADQAHWGPLTPRSIPPLSAETTAPLRVVTVAPLRDEEQRLGWRVFDPTCVRRGGEKKRTLYATFLYSTCPQSVTLGLFWGPHYLNGEELTLEPDHSAGNRMTATAQLQPGWNLLYGEVEMLADSWGMLVGLPRSSDLLARAEPRHDCPDVVRYTDALLEADLPSLRQAPPSHAEALETMPVHWRRLAPGETSGLPAREVAWDQPGPPLETPSWQVDQLTLDFSDATAQVVVFDFGGEFLGHPLLDLDAPAGTVVDLAVDERLRDDGVVALFATNPFTNTVDRFITREGEQRFEGFHVRGGRYLQLTFRRPKAEGAEVRLHRVAVRKAQVSLTVDGRFECSDPVFNWTWQAGVQTVLACTEDAYLDCPWRERGMYLGDAYVIARAQRMLNADLRLARRGIRLWAQGQRAEGQFQCVMPAWHQTPHGDFSLLWVLLLRDYWAWTGDAALVAEVWPALERLLASETWVEAPSGLWSAEGRNLFVDWGATKESKGGDENAALNAFRCRALHCSAELARVLGKGNAATRFETDADRVRDAFQRRLWDEELLRFRAGLSGNRFLDTPALHANVLALAYDLPTADQLPSVLDYVLAALRENVSQGVTVGQNSGHVELYFLTYVLEALYKHGRVRDAEQVLRQHYGLLQENGAWTLWECFCRGVHNTGSLCHAWSCAPLVTFMTEVLGVRPAEPGHPDALLLTPCAETLTFARGVFPHPKGSLHVAWRREGNLLQMEVEAPPGVTVTVQPRGALAGCRLALNLRPASAPLTAGTASV